MKRLAGSILLALLFAMLSAPAQAAINDIRFADSGIGLEFGAKDFKYGEDVGNTTFDTENGWMPDIGANGGMLFGPNTKSPWLDNFYLNVDGQAAVGNSHYNGGLQNLHTGAVTPYQSTTNDDIYTFSFKIGRGFGFFDQVMVIPFTDFGYRYWQRALTGTGGYTENYNQGEFQLGGLVQWSPIPQWVLSLSAEGGTTVAPQMNALGTTYNLGADAIWQLGGKLSYAFAQNFDVNGALTMKGFGYGASPVVNGAYEPNSYTHETTILLGIGYHWL